MAFELTGIDDVMQKLGSALSSAGDLTKAGMQEVVSDIWQRAADRAPVKSGDLRGSGNLWVEEEGDTIIGEVRFNAKYAARQHEHVEYAHPQGGEAKYLEKAALEKAEQVREQIAASLSDLFGGL